MKVAFLMGSLALCHSACGGDTWSRTQAAPSTSGGGASPVNTGTATPSGSGNAVAPLVILDGGRNVPRNDAGLGTTAITAIVRDFKFWNMRDATTNADFENVVGDDRGIVANVLGADKKPVYKNPAGVTRTTHGKADFDQWYNDVPGTNIQRQIAVALSMSSPGTYGYDSLVSGVPLSPSNTQKMWFPIDDGTQYATMFGNQGQAHNYSFTTEIHTVFVYNGGETFSFSGDDDVFVFINNQLVIDLGGVHVREQATVGLDTLPLVKGQQYPLDIFNAERHMQESNLSFTTTIRLQPAAM